MVRECWKVYGNRRKLYVDTVGMTIERGQACPNCGEDALSLVEAERKGKHYYRVDCMACGRVSKATRY